MKEREIFNNTTILDTPIGSLEVTVFEAHKGGLFISIFLKGAKELSLLYHGKIIDLKNGFYSAEELN